MADTPDQIAASIASNIATIDNSLDVKFGPFMDVVCQGVAPEISNAEAEAEHLAQLTSIYYASIMSNSEMDAFAASWSIARGGGGYAAGNVYFFSYSIPQADVIINVGQQVATSDFTLVFATNDTATFPLASLTSYFSPLSQRYEFPVPCTAVSPGSTYAVPSQAISKMVTPLAGIDGCYNPSQFSGGTSPLNNDQMAVYIQAKFMGLSDETGGAVSTDVLNAGVTDLNLVYSNDPIFKRVTSGPGIDVVCLGWNGTVVTQSYTALGGETDIVLSQQPCYSLTSVLLDNTPQTEGTDYSFAPDQSDQTGGSSLATDMITFFAPLQAGQAVIVTFVVNTMVSGAQEAVVQDGGVYFGTDILARLPILVPVTVSINYSRLASYSDSAIQTSIIGLIQSFFYTTFFTVAISPQSFLAACKSSLTGLSGPPQLVVFSRNDSSYMAVTTITFNMYEYPTVSLILNGGAAQTISVPWITTPTS